MSIKRPPKAAVKALKLQGHVVDEWTKRGDWWVGYSRSHKHICTVAVTTTEAAVEILVSEAIVKVPL